MTAPGVAHPLVGRAAELDRLDAAMDEVRVVGPRVVLCCTPRTARSTTNRCGRATWRARFRSAPTAERQSSTSLVSRTSGLC
jgi:hypothetical protein